MITYHSSKKVNTTLECDFIIKKVNTTLECDFIRKYIQWNVYCLRLNFVSALGRSAFHTYKEHVLNRMTSLSFIKIIVNNYKSNFILKLVLK